MGDVYKRQVVDAEQNNKATVFGYRVSDPEQMCIRDRHWGWSRIAIGVGCLQIWYEI